jgi:hypothetical protein
MLYDLEFDGKTNEFRLITNQIVYTEFFPALNRITVPEPGNVEDFVSLLQQKLDRELGGAAPDAPLITDVPLV